MADRYDLRSSRDLQLLRMRVRSALLKQSGNLQDIDDVTQYILTKWLSGVRHNSTIDYLVIDYLRESSGRKGNKTYETKRNLSIPLSLDELKSVAVDPETCVVAIADVISTYVSDQRSRIIAKLYYVWGFSLREIGDLFEITESRVCMIIKKIERDIIQSIKHKECESGKLRALRSSAADF